MQNVRSLKGWVGTVTGLVSVLLISAMQYRRSLDVQKPEVTESEISRVIGQFRASSTPLEVLDLDEQWRNKSAGEQFRAAAGLPDPSRYDRAELNRVLDAGAKCASVVTGDAKLRAWFDFKCGRAPNLNSNVWQKAPLTHPLGGSWAYWLYTQKFDGAEWLAAQKPYLHALELRHLPSGKLTFFEKFLSELSPQALDGFVRGNPVTVTKSYVWLLAFSSAETQSGQFYSRADWNHFFAQAPLQLGEDETWRVNPSFARSYADLYLAMMILSVVGLVGIAAISQYARVNAEERMREHQQLLVQTLAHELRHPVMGLDLAVEAIRPSYDLLPGETQTEFLRVATISQRMLRLVHFSQQYLKVLGSEGELTMRREPVTSFKEFFEGHLESVGDAIRIEHPSFDAGGSVDGYWLGICVTNLVRNALEHGRKPVVVSWSSTGRALIIVVQDAGDGPKCSLSELTSARVKPSGGSGMGLGLSLVMRLAHLMNGTLQLELEPTRLVLTLKDTVHEEAAAG